MRLACLVIAGAMTACGASSNSKSTVPAPPTTAPASATETEKADVSNNPTGLRTVVSQHSFADTLTRLLAAIAAKKLLVFAKVEHSDNAKRAGLALPSTTLVIFGKPQVGTQLMNASRTAAIDLPQKMLVWQDGDAVKITYNDPGWLSSRHSLASKSALISKIKGLLTALANKAAQAE